MLPQRNYSMLDWWDLQTDENGTFNMLYLVRQSDYDSLKPKCGQFGSFPRNATHILSFETFLMQWVKKKWDSSSPKPLFSVYIFSENKKYQFSILAWGHDEKRNLCLLAVCCASYFTDDHPHKPNRNKAYIEKTESVGLRDVTFKKYHFSKTVSLTIAMKTAFTEYMGVLGCQVHLWAYPAEVNVDNNTVYDLLLPGAGKNRSEQVQRRTQKDLLELYIKGYQYFGITPKPFQLDIVLPQMADIPIFLSNKDNDDGDGLDVKQAEFDEAVGRDIKQFKEALANRFNQIKEQSNAINKRLEESTLILCSQYCIFSSNEKENSFVPLIKISHYNSPKLDDENALPIKLKTLNFHTLDKVVESSQQLSKFLEEVLKVKLLDFNGDVNNRVSQR